MKLRPQNLVQGQIQTLNVQNSGIILPNRTLVLYNKDQPARRITAMGLVMPTGPINLTITSGAFWQTNRVRPQSSICVSCWRSRDGPTSKRSIVVNVTGVRLIVCPTAVAPNRWFTSYL